MAINGVPFDLNKRPLETIKPADTSRTSPVEQASAVRSVPEFRPVGSAGKRVGERRRQDRRRALRAVAVNRRHGERRKDTRDDGKSPLIRPRVDVRV
jgi:hypothetical protein